MQIKEFLLKNKKIIAIVSIVTIILIGILVFYAQSTKAVETNVSTEKTFPVKVLNIENTDGTVYLNYAGMVQPNDMEQATVTAVSKVNKMYVKEGDNVVAGQVLFTLDDSDAVSRQDSAYRSMQAAENAMNSSKSALDSAQKAYDESAKSPSADEINKANQELSEAKAERDLIQTEIDRINNMTQNEQNIVAQKKNNLSEKQAEYDIAYTAANSPSATPEDAIALNVATQNLLQAQDEYNQANTALVQAQNNLGLNEKQAQLTSANARVNAAQLEIDRLNNQTSSENIALENQLNIAKNNYENSKTTYENAKSNYESSTENLGNYSYKAQNNGKILKIITAEGETATPLAPVIIIGTETMTAQFGLSQTDVKTVEVGMNAQVTISGNTYTGTISKIDTMPDTTSRTYLTTVIINNAPKDLYLGEIATVKIDLGSKTGLWIPLSVIMNDGTDYVYVVENGRAARKDIVIQDIDNDIVRVTGISSGDIIIKEGMKTVKNGQLVSVVSEG